MDFFGKKINKKELLEKIGNMSQLGGMSSFEYNDGVSKGVRAFQIKCISGFDMTVLADRGMDISHLFYKSIPLNWNSVSGESAPSYYDSRGFEWLRSFYGGLLTTCGLLNVGDPSSEEGQELGLHGRISNTPFEKISMQEEWHGDDFLMRLTGKAKESVFKGHKLEMTRTITSFMFDPKIIIEDSILNGGYTTSPLMLLYHINIGYPLLDRTSELLLNKHKTLPIDDISKSQIKNFHTFKDPIIDFKDEVFFHEVLEDEQGMANVAIVNEAFDNHKGFGFWIRFCTENLPYLTQWKHLEKGEYVCGLEPCNTFTRGRAVERKENNLKFIEPGERKHYRLEFNILKSNNDIETWKKKYSMR